MNMKTLIESVVKLVRKPPENQAQAQEAINEISDNVNNLLKGLPPDVKEDAGKIAQTLIARSKFESDYDYDL